MIFDNNDTVNECLSFIEVIISVLNYNYITSWDYLKVNMNGPIFIKKLKVFFLTEPMRM